ncbi:MAG TPA: FAD-dependent thymidylate synthase [Candidatus Dormibacteraeota bacterium]|nr:FAD-dependent thymidylate synthase [Candidatus Dormibacteraeota bacterium]
MTSEPSSAIAPLVDTARPRVSLRNWFQHPYDSAIAAARTCYSPRLVQPEEVTDKQRLTIGAGTFYGGHHTVFQHAHFEFGLENVSRQFVWSFLHAHPFYNSEQQSQRYVRLDRAQAYVPEANEAFGPAEREIYERAVARAWEHYRQLTEMLKPDARRILGEIWHVGDMSHPKRTQKVERQAEKRAIEVARYVLPVAAFTTMVHTLSGIVLHRLWRMALASDTPAEGREVIGAMVERVHEVDPQFFDRFESEPLENLPEWNFPGASAAGGEDFIREFDGRLAGRVSRLIDFSPQAIQTVAAAYRATVGLPACACPDAEAIDRLLNPARNPYRLETLNVGVHSPMMRALDHAHFTFAKRISHTADSQDQRHRMVPGSRPLLTLTAGRSPDYVTPRLIAGNPQALALYRQAMEEAWTAKNELIDRGVPRELALYLLPNATAIRIVESGSLLHLLHKWTMRTCFNAQEEIYDASIQEVEQVREHYPALGRYLGPPCYLRAAVTTPICTEGSHFCGIKVWQSFPAIERPL